MWSLAVVTWRARECERGGETERGGQVDVMHIRGERASGRGENLSSAFQEQGGSLVAPSKATEITGVRGLCLPLCLYLREQQICRKPWDDLICLKRRGATCATI